MRIYGDCYELMSETARNLYEMGIEVKPKTYQNKSIEGNSDYHTKEIMCEQYCLIAPKNIEALFIYTKSKAWADQEFIERVSGVQINPGTAYLERKDVWEEFLTPVGKFDYTYPERMSESVREPFYQDDVFKRTTYLKAIIKLLKEDPDTRKAVLSIYSPVLDANHLDGDERVPCSMYYDFLIRDNNQGQKVLNLVYHQRSSDFITHFGNDVYLALKLQEYVACELGILSGYFYHTIDSLHCYIKDYPILKESIGTFLGNQILDEL